MISRVELVCGCCLKHCSSLHECSYVTATAAVATVVIDGAVDYVCTSC